MAEHLPVKTVYMLLLWALRLWTVSYTHLDREALNHLLDAFPNITVLDIWKTSDVRADKSDRWFNAVSYTHLDVYKRQVIRCKVQMAHIFDNLV